MYGADPNGRGLGELAFDSRQREVFGIHPDPSPEQVDFLPLWNNIDHVSSPAIEKSGPHHLKCVIILVNLGHRARHRTREFRFHFQGLA